MGVPGLFAWLRKRYSSIAQMVVRDREGRWMGCSPPDNLYIDTNHRVHACAHATAARGLDRLSDEEIYARIEVRSALTHHLLPQAGRVLQPDRSQ